jgi:hypothetical protein
MFIFSVISDLLLALMLMNMMAKVRPWSRKPAPGKEFKSLPMNFLSRIQLHRFSLMALGTGIAHGLITGWLPLNTAGMIAMFATVIVLFPMQYSLTTKGVAMGAAMFYPWSDFSRVVPKKSSLELAHPSSWKRLTLFVKPAEMDSVVKYVARHVKNGPTNLQLEESEK